MANCQRNAIEEKVLRKLVPWLSLQLGDKLEWKGRPEDAGYTSMCPSAMSVGPRLDAELCGNRVKVVLEHTTVDPFANQRGISSVLTPLALRLRQMRAVVPRGNSVTLCATTESIRRAKLTRSAVKQQMPALEATLREYLSRLPKNPTQEDTIRGKGDLLEEPFSWRFGSLEVAVHRHWIPEGSSIECVLTPTTTEWKKGLHDCLNEAMKRKIGGKSSSYEAYRSEGWLAVVVVELAGFQISSISSAADAFRLLAPDLGLHRVDGIVVLSDLDDGGGLLKCCWAYLRGEVRSPKQQYAEECQCFGVKPNM